MVGKINLKKIFVFLLVSFLSLSLLIVSSYGLEKSIFYFFDPIKGYVHDKDFQYDENLVFYSCPSGEFLNNSIVCNSEEIKLSYSNWGDCYLSSFDLATKSCDSWVVQTTFLENGTETILSKDLIISKKIPVEESLLADQAVDGSFGSALDTAYAIYALSHFNDKFAYQIDAALNWLKINRNNEKKCWPKDDCDRYTTSNIFALLSIAGVNDTLRVFRDAKTYVEDAQNYIYGTPWPVSIQARAESNCTFTHKDSASNVLLTESMSMTAKEEKEYSLEVSYYDDFAMECNNYGYLYVNNYANKKVFMPYFSARNLSFALQGPCWSKFGNWETCNGENTLYALIGDINESRKLDVVDWFKEYKLVSDGTVKKYVDVKNKTLFTSLYVKHIEQDTNLIDWLIYHQNNDGSWDDGNYSDDFITTAHVLGSLTDMYSDSSEFIKDAKLWLLESYPKYGFDSVQKNSVALPIIYSQVKPILKSSPAVIVMNESIYKFSLYNPTEFNIKDLKYQFSKNLEGLIKLDHLNINISSNSTIEFEISYDDIEDGVHKGYVVFHKNNYNYVLVPIVVIKKPELSINYKNKISVLGDKTSLDISFAKSDSEFSCDVSLSGIHNVEKVVELPDSGDLKIALSLNSSDVRYTNVFNGFLNCTSRSTNFSFPIDFVVEQYPKVPFVLVSDELYVDYIDKNAIVKLINLVDDNISINVEYNGVSAELLELYLNRGDGVFVLKPFNDRILFKNTNKVVLKNMLPDDQNTSINDTITFSFLDYSVKMDVVVNVNTDVLNREFPLGISIFGLLLFLSGLFVFRKRERIKLVIKNKEYKTLFNKQKKEIVAETEAGNDLGSISRKKKKTTQEERLLKVSNDVLTNVDNHLFKIAKALNDSMGKKDKDLVLSMNEKGFSVENISILVGKPKEDVDKIIEAGPDDNKK